MVTNNIEARSNMWKKIGTTITWIVEKAKWIKWGVYLLIAAVVGWWLYSNNTKITRLEEGVTYYSNKWSRVTSAAVINPTNSIPEDLGVNQNSNKVGSVVTPEVSTTKLATRIDIQLKPDAGSSPQVIAFNLGNESEGTRFRLPIGWDAQCLVYAHEEDFDRMINIRGISNPQWIQRGPKSPPLEAGTHVSEFWIRNKDSRPIKVEFLLSPTPAK
jgi:hypothetical protein